jgi:anti-sigma-K factor RskA
MLVERIQKALSSRPWWGAETLARKLGTTPKTVRVVASKAGIKLMTRYDVEAELDRLVTVIESLGADNGKAE